MTARTFPERAPPELAVAARALRYGLQLSGSVSLALLVAFYAQLDEPWWAGGSAAIVCQPVLGASLRKSAFRLLGTLSGAVAIVAATAAFPQDRIGFTFLLAGWCALCCFVGTRLAEFAAYSAVLSGYTALIVGGAAVTDPPNVFTIALDRTSNVVIGIVVATVVLILSEGGSARRKLAAELCALATSVLRGLAGGTTDLTEGIVRLAAVPTLLDQARGEGTYWRVSPGPVRAALDGLFVAFAHVAMRTEAGGSTLVQRLLVAVDDGDAPAMEAVCWDQAASSGPKLRRAFEGAGTALAVAAWLDGRYPRPPDPAPSYAPPADPIPALLNAARVFACVATMATIWMATRWTAGPGAMTFAGITVLLCSIRVEGAGLAAVGFVVGTGLAVIAAATVRFAVLPFLDGPVGFTAVMVATLGPVAALATLRRTAFATPFLVNFVPILAPTNVTHYDTAAFYNSASAILLGCMAAAVFLFLIPPLSPAALSGRAIMAARRDVRALQERSWHPASHAWEGRMRVRATSVAVAGQAAVPDMLAIFDAGQAAIAALEAP